MQRRKFIAAMGSLTAAGAAGLGTGAFSSVEADRDVAVQVAEDANAYLSLSASGEDNDHYFVEGDDGVAGIDLSSSNQTSTGGAGLNAGSATKIFNIMEVKNQGTQPVLVWTPPEGIEGDDTLFSNFDPHATDLVHYSDYWEGLSYTLEDEVSMTDSNPHDKPGSLTLGAGESFNLGFWMNLKDGASPGDSDTVTVTLEADTSMAVDPDA